MTIATDSVLRVVPTFSVGTKTKMQNVYHMVHQTASPQNETAVVLACLEAVEEYMDNFQATLHDTVELDSIEVYERVSGLWEPIGEIASTWAATGAASDRSPAGCALMVNLFKARTGHNDRKYISGFQETLMQDEEWQSAILTAGAAYVVDVYSPFTASNSVIIKACHWNRGTDTTAFYTGGVAIPRIAYQRRRKPGVGLT